MGEEATAADDSVVKRLRLRYTGTCRGWTWSRTASGGQTGVPVQGVLCFIDAEWPVIGGDVSVAGVAVLWPGKLAGLFAQPGQLDQATIADLQRRLHTALPPYHPPSPPAETPTPRHRRRQRRLLPLLARPLVSFGLMGLLIWSVYSGALAELARALATLLASLVLGAA